MTTLEIALTLVIALLYVLGTYQGTVIAEEVDEYLRRVHGEELSDGHRRLLVWAWPVATIKVLLQKDEEEE